MKKIKIILLLIFLIILLIYVSNITSIPDSIVLFKGESMNLKTVLGLKLEQKNNSNLSDFETIQTSTNLKESSNNIGKVDLSLSLFGKIPLKDVTVDVLPKTKVIPVRKYSRCKIIY